jgi:hypothetical protein
LSIIVTPPGKEKGCPGESDRWLPKASDHKEKDQADGAYQTVFSIRVCLPRRSARSLFRRFVSLGFS